MPAAPSPPASLVDYRRRESENQSLLLSAEVASGRLASLRLASFALALVLAVLSLSAGWSWWFFLGALALFAGAVARHLSAERRRWTAARRLVLAQAGIARIEDRWAGSGPEGLAWRPDGHLYADDLDLFGRGSLFQLLASGTRTRAGEEALARWLLAPAAPPEIRARQEAVRELTPDADLRERLALLEGDVASAMDGQAAAGWAGMPSVLAGRWVPLGARVIGLAGAACLLGWMFLDWGFLPFGVSLLAQVLWTVRWWGPVAAVLAHAARPSRDLALLGRVWRELERLPARSPWLEDLVSSVVREGRPPSLSISRLARLMDYVESRSNQIFLPVSWVLGLGTQLAFAIERWRRENGEDLGRWIETAGRFEALLALSGYAWEHPEDVFPEILEGDARFEGRGLRHPLLPAATAIANDVHLVAPGQEGGSSGVSQAYLVSGSNMSGKSTLLRTVGVATVLAQAGAPVRAEALSLSPLAVGASIRVTDSLQGGESRFYAEIARLRRIVDRLGGEPPVLFLLDEILHGTNSHDRRIGAEAVLRTLLEGHAIGLVTTHDLALAAIAGDDLRLENVHFEDRLDEGRMVFDYRLRPGVVEHSNAIALMRAVGLEV